MQWNKYPRSVAEWIFIPLRRPPICLSYPSNICGASLPEAFRLSTSISGGYSNNSCSSARSLFSLFRRFTSLRSCRISSARHIAFSGVRSSMSRSPFFAACTHQYSVQYGTFSSSLARFTPISSASFTDCSL